jgi:hypothetical protein
MRVATASGSGRFATKEGKNRRENRRQPARSVTKEMRLEPLGRREFLGRKGRMSDENAFGIALQVAVEQAVHGPVFE